MMTGEPSIDLDTSFRRAVDNIAAWGDTDVFPLPPENHALYDRRDAVVALLNKMHADFGSWRDQYGPVNESALAMVGYTAFRWVTQIDPVWNAYLLGLVLALADHIERARLPRHKRVIFSYRYEMTPRLIGCSPKALGETSTSSRLSSPKATRMFLFATSPTFMLVSTTIG